LTDANFIYDLSAMKNIEKKLKELKNKPWTPI